MAFTFTNATARAEALITALSASPTPKELMIAFKAQQGLAVSNYATLENKIQVASDAQTGATPEADVMLVNIMMGATQARTLSTVDEVLVTSTAVVNVPANCVGVLVTCGAGGGGGGGLGFADVQTVGCSGGGSGAYVTDFLLGVTAGGTLNVIVGSSTANANVEGAGHTVGALVINGGKNGVYDGWNDGSPRTLGGDGGTVTHNGVPQANGGTVQNGVKGGDGGNFSDRISDAGSDGFGYDGGEGGDTYGGGGAAGWGGDGGDGGRGNGFTIATNNGRGYNGLPGGGGGGMSPNADVALADCKGGAPTPNVMLKFLIETVVT